MAPKSEEMSVVVVEQGEQLKMASNGHNEAIDGMTNTAVVLIADWFPGREVAAEQ